MMSEVTITDLLGRRYIQGTTVTNCVKHIDLDLTKRPLETCNLCRADVNNTLSRAIQINEWLNEWKDDAMKILDKL